MKPDEAAAVTVPATGRFWLRSFATAAKVNEASMNEADVPHTEAELGLGYGVALTSQRYTVYEVPAVTAGGTVIVPPRTGGSSVLPV